MIACVITPGDYLTVGAFMMMPLLRLYEWVSAWRDWSNARAFEASAAEMLPDAT